MRVIFEAKYRDDGTMFVTSPNMPSFSAVGKTGDWNLVFELAAKDTEVNGSASVSPSGRDVHGSFGETRRGTAA